MFKVGDQCPHCPKGQGVIKSYRIVQAAPRPVFGGSVRSPTTVRYACSRDHRWAEPYRKAG